MFLWYISCSKIPVSRDVWLAKSIRNKSYDLPKASITSKLVNFNFPKVSKITKINYPELSKVTSNFLDFERERERRERERETDRQTDRQTDTERERDRQTDRQVDREIERQRESMLEWSADLEFLSLQPKISRCVLSKVSNTKTYSELSTSV